MRRRAQSGITEVYPDTLSGSEFRILSWGILRITCTFKSTQLYNIDRPDPSNRPKGGIDFVIVTSSSDSTSTALSLLAANLPEYIIDFVIQTPL